MSKNNTEIPVIDEENGGYVEIFQDHEGKEIRRVFHKQNNLIKVGDIIKERLDNIPNQSMKFKSKQQLDEERPQFALLEQDDYELTIVKTEPKVQKKYMSDKDEEVMNITLEVVGYKNGEQANDKDGIPALGRKVFFTLRPESMGFMRDGTPSKSRSFIAWATGQEILGELELEAWEKLLGKTIYAEVVTYTTQKGELRNKISRILPPPREK